MDTNELRPILFFSAYHNDSSDWFFIRNLLLSKQLSKNYYVLSELYVSTNLQVMAFGLCTTARIKSQDFNPNSN